MELLSGCPDETDVVLGARECSDCDTCLTMVCPQEFLGRGSKTNILVDDLGDKIKKTFSVNNGDTL